METRGRRQILAGLGLGAVAVVAAPGLVLSACSSDANDALAADVLVPLGRAYLAQVPHEADAAALARMVDGLSGVHDGRDARALLARLGPTIEREFAADQTVAVRGWVLARSEARVAAYLALR